MKNKKASFLSWELATARDEAALETLWKEAEAQTLAAYTSVHRFSLAFENRTGYSARSVQRVFHRKPEKRIITEKILMDILDFFGYEVEKKVEYTVRLKKKD